MGKLVRPRIDTANEASFSLTINVRFKKQVTNSRDLIQVLGNLVYLYFFNKY